MRRDLLIGGDVGAFFGDGAAHHGDEEDEEGGEGGGDPEDVEVGEGEGLLAAGDFEDLQGHQAREVGVSGLLREEGLALMEDLSDGGVEGVEVFVEAEGVELFAAFEDGLGDGGSDAAAFVAEEGEETDGACARSGPRGIY